MSLPEGKTQEDVLVHCSIRYNRHVCSASPPLTGGSVCSTPCKPHTSPVLIWLPPPPSPSTLCLAYACRHLQPQSAPPFPGRLAYQPCLPCPSACGCPLSHQHRKAMYVSFLLELPPRAEVPWGQELSHHCPPAPTIARHTVMSPQYFCGMWHALSPKRVQAPSEAYSQPFPQSPKRHWPTREDK